MMREAIWVPIGLLGGAAIAAVISVVAGFPTQAVVPVVFWSVMICGLVVRIVRAVLHRTRTPIADPVAGAMRSWEENYLGRHPGIRPMDPPSMHTQLVIDSDPAAASDLPPAEPNWKPSK